MNLVGNPSSGKSPALDAPLSLLRELETELGVDHPETIRQWESQRELAKAKRVIWEGEVKTAVDNGAAPPDIPEDAAQPDKPVMPRLCLSDTTPEALGRLMAAHPKGLYSTVTNSAACWMASTVMAAVVSGPCGWKLSRPDPTPLWSCPGKVEGLLIT